MNADKWMTSMLTIKEDHDPIYSTEDMTAPPRSNGERPPNYGDETSEGYKPSPPKVYSTMEKLLLPVALLIAILFNRLLIAPLTLALHNDMFIYFSAFWLCYLIIFCVFFWKRVRKDPVLWYVGVCVAALCIWNFIYNSSWGLAHFDNVQFSAISLLVIPGVLMAHAQWAAGRYTLKNHVGMAAAWFMGWFYKPFSGLGALFGSANSLVSESNKPMAKRAAIGILVAALLLAIIIPLLMSADQVFHYYVSQVFTSRSNISGGFTALFWHGLSIVIVFGLFYSFLWNVGFVENEFSGVKSSKTIDNLVSAIVLGSVITVYVFFCLVQFTFLFARAGLPAGMTFSEYARQGFAQTIVVCAVNLLLFGVFLRFGVKGRLLKTLISGLLALTGVMLFSGAVRLNLYIGAFGMTWLRLLSAWFIIYLIAVIALCAVKLLWKKQLPVLAISALLLLGWYVALGFLNPDGFVQWFNLNRGSIF